MSNLTRGQKWLLACFVASAAYVATTLFLSGDVKTFAYVIISLIFAGFAVIQSSGKSKNQA